MEFDNFNNTHTTDGHKYLIPSHPKIISALGRVIYNFLSFESTVVTILFEAGFMPLWESRKLMAGGKKKALDRLKDRMIIQDYPSELIDLLDKGISGFEIATADYRNAISHAVLFTAGTDAEGNYLPGIAASRKINGESVSLVTPELLHGEAKQIENEMKYLNQFRIKLKEYLEAKRIV